MDDNASSQIAYAVRLLRPFWKMAVFATFMGAANSLAAVALLSIIQSELHAEAPASMVLVASFAGLFFVLLASEIASGVANSFVGQDAIAAMRKDLVQKILSAPIAEIERFQSHRIITALNQDVNSLSDFSRGFAFLVVSVCETVGAAAYLITLSLPMFLVCAAVGGGAWLVIRHLLKSAHANLSLERQISEQLQKHYNALVDGAKELRVNRERRRRFLDAKLLATIDQMRDASNRSFLRFATGSAIDDASFFLIAGMLIALAPFISESSATLSGFVLVLMFMKGPVSHIVAVLPALNRMFVAFAAVAELSDKFASPESNLLQDALATPGGKIESLELRGAAYAFPHAAGGESFTLGPVDLVFSAGEIAFIMGENGSGKTTLIKLILGLYPPRAGEILLNGEAVTDIGRDDYRQNFSAIFFDFYLFDDLIVADEQASQAVRFYLERLDIAHKVRVEAGAFSTTDLSAGQRKRLALIGTYLERRPIIVFDEWAAEQDPTFRRIFYMEILPELKRQGKMLIVVSHDDRYFEVADRIIHIHEGCVSAQPFLRQATETETS
ncbi:cyclic peptide export ABC transporter [Methylocapsa acidiphila]|uniref:cyclic peptide export ABC transporter n=1 Tax=Methylocapsa acidiphila TaxID=133552 RepID=UPI0004179D17|nr:cyclic peptide export ABC transporter [Methylocapsa acidiphila]